MCFQGSDLGSLSEIDDLASTFAKVSYHILSQCIVMIICTLHSLSFGTVTNSLAVNSNYFTHYCMYVSDNLNLCYDKIAYEKYWTMELSNKQYHGIFKGQNYSYLAILLISLVEMAEEYPY